MPRRQLAGADPKKPWHSVYGRNRYSGNLQKLGTYGSLEEARKVKKELQQGAGADDYTYRIVSSWERP